MAQVHVPGNLEALDRFADELALLLKPQLEQLDREVLHVLVRQAAEKSQMVGALEHPRSAARLPVAMLKPNEVIEQRKVAMSQASLYRATDAGRFYCLTPPGKAIGRLYPAWQFEGEVPELLADCLNLLNGHTMSSIHAFWVSPADELDELSPAEVLAGMAFEVRPELESGQQRLLNLATPRRLAKVREVASMEPWCVE